MSKSEVPQGTFEYSPLPQKRQATCFPSAMQPMRPGTQLVSQVYGVVGSTSNSHPGPACADVMVVVVVTVVVVASGVAISSSSSNSDRRSNHIVVSPSFTSVHFLSSFSLQSSKNFIRSMVETSSVLITWICVSVKCTCSTKPSMCSCRLSSWCLASRSRAGHLSSERACLSMKLVMSSSSSSVEMLPLTRSRSEVRRKWTLWDL
mmetsp:Transcript_87093/g.186733  ORF Transcript_87093/g.186733 Transcript_87093/m.186733 type:complete len:205 (+) Transcript_87093:1404-2018(+)